MLELKLLHSSQYRQVAEWEFGPQGEGTDWAKYEAEMNAPQWTHFGLYDGNSFVGCISLERLDPQMMAFHVVTARKKVHPRDLADACIGVAGYLFNQGFTAVVAHNPVGKRAGARLAIRCGLKEWGHTPTTRYFMLTRKRFQVLHSFNK